MNGRGRPKQTPAEKVRAAEIRELAKTAVQDRTNAIVEYAATADRGGLKDERDAPVYGPAMAAIPERWRTFVLALVQTGCTNSQAYRAAGFTGTDNSVKTNGYKLRHDPRVMAAYFEETAKLMADHAVMAIGVLKEVAENITVDPKARIKAASELLSRSGFSAITEHRITVDKGERRQDPKVVAAQIVAAGRALGLNLDPGQLLGAAEEPVDAEFEEVSPTIPPELADIL